MRPGRFRATAARRTIRVAALTGLAAMAAAAPAGAFPLCDSGPRVDCVVDGDTLWLEGRKIRLEHIDAPEIGSGARCAAEAAAGWRAAERLAELLSGGQPRLESDGRTDRFGRLLARVTVNGRDVGDELVPEGLARAWTGRREEWCGARE